MSKYKVLISLVHLGVVLLSSNTIVYAQLKYKTIPLPVKINGVNEEYSGLAQLGNRVYLLPQYGGHKETRLEGDFFIYSLQADSINKVISGADSALTAYRALKLINLNKLPQKVKQSYQGFESICFIRNEVYLTIETADTAANCFVLKGTIDTVRNTININYKDFATLKRPYYIDNGGFEGVTYLPKENRLIATYEFNAAPAGGTGFLIDTSLTRPPEPIKLPFLYFRLTDLAATKKDLLYAINYYWDGEYDQYLNNGIVKNATGDIVQRIPALKDSLIRDPQYLKEKTFARIISLKNYKAKKWKEIAVFDGVGKNWEGFILFNKGALIVTDANRSVKQQTVLAYLKFNN